MYRARSPLAFAALGSLLALGCKGDANKAPPPTAPPAPTTAPTAPTTAPLVTEAAPIKEPPPGALAFLAPPLGPPDLIAPPTLELIPGMKVAEATAKGAKPTAADADDWRWRPEADLKVDKQHGIIKEIVGKYSVAELEALKQKWGKPTFGDDYWMGANWLAEIGDCHNTPPCAVYFTRAPNEQFFGKAPVPPLGLAKLAFDMPIADVTKLFGFESDEHIATGYDYNVSFGWGVERFRSVGLTNVGFRKQDELAHLTSLWGAPTKVYDKLVWVAPTARWAVVYEVGRIEYHPIVLWSDLLAKTGPYSLVAMGTQLLGHKKAEVGAETRVWPGSEADPEQVIALELSFEGADEVATSISTTFGLPAPAIAAHVAMIEQALGKATVTKNANGEDEAVITTDGLTIKLVQQMWGIEMTMTKAAS